MLQVRGGLWVESTDGRGRVLLPTAYLDKRIEDTGRPTVDLGWASTVYSAQGRTVDQAVMVVDENTAAEALYAGMSRGRTSNVAVGGDDTEDLADLMRAAVQSPTASEVVLDDWPYPAEAAEAEVPAEDDSDPETVERQRVEEEQEQITTGGPGQRRTAQGGTGRRGRPGRTAAGVGRPGAAAAGRAAGDRQDRTAAPTAGQTPGSGRTGSRPGEHRRGTAECPSPGQDPRRAEPRLHQAAEGRGPAAGTDHRVRAADTRRPPPTKRNSGSSRHGRSAPKPPPVLDRSSSSRRHASSSPTRPRSDRTGQAPKSGSNLP